MYLIEQANVDTKFPRSCEHVLAVPEEKGSVTDYSLFQLPWLQRARSKSCGKVTSLNCWSEYNYAHLRKKT